MARESHSTNLGDPLMDKIKIAISLIILSISFSNTIFIPEDYATIQEGIDASIACDTILVSIGIYYESSKNIIN